MNYIKVLLNDFVEYYRKYFYKTIGTAITYTTICFIAMALLLKFSNFDNSTVNRQVSLMSYIIARYSAKNIYSLVDLSKTVLLLFISLFSISLFKLKADESNESKTLSTISFVKTLSFKGVLFLILMFLFCSGLDYYLFQLKGYAEINIPSHGFQMWVISMLFYLRIYMPLLLFSVTQYILINKRTKITIKKVVFVLFSLWLINEFSYEVISYVRRIFFDLVVVPFDVFKQFYIESILSIPLIAFFFVGFHVAMLDAWNISEQFETPL